jgi:hypothetical protein
MRSSLAYIETIKELRPIPGADQIECAVILGWELVVKKNEFVVGDKAVYIEIDSVLPEMPAFQFLAGKNYRIKTIRLKGQISQGIAFPLSVISEVDPTVDISKLKIGDDVTQLLKIKQYETPEERAEREEEEQQKRSWLANKWQFLKWKLFKVKPVRKGNFPSDVPKTEEIRVQKMGKCLDNNVGQPVYITEKCEGSSATFVYRKRGGNWLANLFGENYSFQACSRNRIVYTSSKPHASPHAIYQVGVMYKIEEQCRKLVPQRNLAIQGELIGPKIQGNIYKLPSHDFKVFSIYDLDKHSYAGYDELVDLCHQLGLKMVPIISTNIPLMGNIKYYVELSNGKSAINSKIDREGIVVRAMDSSFSFKSINPNYLLKQNA